MITKGTVFWNNIFYWFKEVKTFVNSGHYVQVPEQTGSIRLEEWAMGGKEHGL